MEKMQEKEKEANDDIRIVGNEINAEKCGTVIESRVGKQNHIVFYHKCPEHPRNVHLGEFTIILASKDLLKSLCEKASLRLGNRSAWSCQVKEPGRLVANCTYGGYLRKSQSKGKREKISKKVGCKAVVRTTPLSTNKKLCHLEEDLKNIFCCQTSTKIADGNNLHFSVISTATLEHTGHFEESAGMERTILTSSKDVLEYAQVRTQLRAFLNFNQPGKGTVLKASMLLEETVPEVHVPDNVLESSLARLQQNTNDADEFVQLLNDGTKDNSVEFMALERDSTSGVLT